MAYVAAKCPNCGGDLQLNDKMELGFCIHCGSKIRFEEAINNVRIDGEVNVAGIVQVENLVKIIKRDLENGRNQTKEFIDRLNRALELDPDNDYLAGLHSGEVWDLTINNGSISFFGDTRHYRVKDLVIPDGITKIVVKAFENCVNLRNVTIPDSVSYIGARAFEGCSNALKIRANSCSCALRYAIANDINVEYINEKPTDESKIEINSIKHYAKEINAVLSRGEDVLNKHYYTLQNDTNNETIKVKKIGTGLKALCFSTIPVWMFFFFILLGLITSFYIYVFLIFIGLGAIGAFPLVIMIKRKMKHRRLKALEESKPGRLALTERQRLTSLNKWREACNSKLVSNSNYDSEDYWNYSLNDIKKEVENLRIVLSECRRLDPMKFVEAGNSIEDKSYYNNVIKPYVPVKCSVCGSEISKESKFCIACGHTVVN